MSPHKDVYGALAGVAIFIAFVVDMAFLLASLQWGHLRPIDPSGWTVRRERKALAHVLAVELPDQLLGAPDEPTDALLLCAQKRRWLRYHLSLLPLPSVAWAAVMIAVLATKPAHEGAVVASLLVSGLIIGLGVFMWGSSLTQKANPRLSACLVVTNCLADLAKFYAAPSVTSSGRLTSSLAQLRQTLPQVGVQIHPAWPEGELISLGAARARVLAEPILCCVLNLERRPLDVDVVDPATAALWNILNWLAGAEQQRLVASDADRHTAMRLAKRNQFNLRALRAAPTLAGLALICLVALAKVLTEPSTKNAL